MRVSILLAAAAAGLAFALVGDPIPPSTNGLGPAAIVENSPVGVIYKAEIDTDDALGYLMVWSNNDGIGVTFDLAFVLPSGHLGPFTYHIHEKPVPADGNCDDTKGLLDPYVRGQEPPCDMSDPANCQIGDLSGKHGKIMPDSVFYDEIFPDLYLSLTPGSPSFIGDRSIVLQAGDGTRLACANFALTDAHFEVYD